MICNMNIDNYNNSNNDNNSFDNNNYYLDISRHKYNYMLSDVLLFQKHVLSIYILFFHNNICI